MDLVNIVKRTVRRLLRPRGWEFRQYDPDLTLDTYLWMLFKHLSIDCVLDVGGRVGDYGVLLRNNGYQGRIISFEPVEANFRRLQKLCAKDPAWTAHHYALGSEDGTAEINVSNGTNYSSFLSPSEYGRSQDPAINVEHIELVQVRRLDRVLSEVTGHKAELRIYLKMDTQGFDLEVLRGAAGCLDKIAALQSELSLQPLYENMTGWTTALTEFRNAGFAVSAFFSGYRDTKLCLSEMDCVMVKTSHRN